jgi:lysylphosphatidylglycerol synthetase-like protein (DUF2156 family)
MTNTTASTPASTPSEIRKVIPKTWKLTTAGILIILAGITAIVAQIIHYATGDLGIFAGIPWVESSASLKGALFATGIVAIVGGIFTFLRKVLWIAIVGVVFSMFFTIWPVIVAGIISILLIATSRREFKRTRFG